MGVLKIKDRWAIEWYDGNGQRKRKAIEKPGEKIEGGWYEAAKKAYRDTKARLDKGESPLFSTSKKTFAEIAVKYLEVYTPKWSPKEAVRVWGMLNGHLLPTFGAKPIAKVRQVDVESYLSRRREEYVKIPCRSHQAGERCGKCDKRISPTTVNKELMRLRHLLNKAIAWGEIRQNPTAGIGRFKEPPEKIAFLDSPEDRVRLLLECEAASPVLRDVVIVAMTTGARLGEILSLTWGDVDTKRRLLTLRKTKSNRVRYVPIHPDLYAVLIRLEPSPDPEARLFSSEWNGSRVSMAFKRAAKRAGLAWFRLHDCRHDFCSWLTMRGVSIRAIQKLAGHSDLRMTERYSHLAERVLVEAVQALPAMPTLPSIPGNGKDPEDTPVGEVLVGAAA